MGGDLDRKGVLEVYDRGFKDAFEKGRQQGLKDALEKSQVAQLQGKTTMLQLPPHRALRGHAGKRR